MIHPLWLYLSLPVLGAILLFMAGFWFGRQALLDLRTGVAVTASRAQHRRQDMPFLYWLTVSLRLFNATACFLLGLALPIGVLVMSGVTQYHHPTRTGSEVMALEMAIETYKSDHGHYPTGDSAAISQALIGGGTEPKVYLAWDKKHLSKTGECLDPWGTPYRFYMADGYLYIRSAGANRKFGDSDDYSTGE